MAADTKHMHFWKNLRKTWKCGNVQSNLGGVSIAAMLTCASCGGLSIHLYTFYMCNHVCSCRMGWCELDTPSGWHKLAASLSWLPCNHPHVQWMCHQCRQCLAGSAFSGCINQEGCSSCKQSVTKQWQPVLSNVAHVVTMWGITRQLRW